MNGLLKDSISPQNITHYVLVIFHCSIICAYVLKLCRSYFQLLIVMKVFQFFLLSHDNEDYRYPNDPALTSPTSCYSVFWPIYTKKELAFCAPFLLALNLLFVH